ncbi:hypothetical protein EJ04DRAFT_587753 [Polyplosphaeria fusca]|uniref:BTB domain-containing protein n=1 Tax=Polyplosphaeria fusca TaxID=682080 RepID=A0A9P4QQG4_9PLEO|nr:hypothetical protein EJ04DRAFT_587753 [Polyplosphaeria fusca]
MDQPEDVQVILSPNHKYKLHSGVLTRNSTLFADLLNERHGAQLSTRAKTAGVKTRWMIELQELQSDEFPGGKLVRLKLDSKGEPEDGGGYGIHTNENDGAPTKTFDYYETILYSFYGRPLKIRADELQAISDVLHLTQIAEYLGCVPVISKPLEVTLIRQGQTLFNWIRKQPHDWAVLARRIESELIFKEAIIHLAGNWAVHSEDEAVQSGLRDYGEIVKIVEKHYDILNKKRSALELAVMSQYPGDLATPSEDRPIRREEYSKDILVWMALCFFRHWLGQKIIMEKGARAKDGGFELYKNLGAAGEAYMDKSILNQLHGRFPLTKKAMNVLENHLLEIKECIKAMIDSHGVLKNESQLDPTKYQVEYLTCVEVERDDIPWLREQDDSFGGIALPDSSRGFRPGGNHMTKEAHHNSRRLASLRVAEGEGEADDGASRKRARFL